MKENAWMLLFAVSLALFVLIYLRVAPYSAREATTITEKFSKVKDDCAQPYTLMNSTGSEKIWKSTDDESTPKIRMSRGMAAICSRFEAGRTPASVWRSHLPEILEAAIGDEEQRVHQNWLKELLHLVSSGNSMERGLRSAPSMAAMNGVLTKVGERLIHINSNSSNSSSSPLQVVIFGGSVTEGAHCNTLPSEIKPFLHKGGTKTVKQCAWPSRLQLLVDAFLGPDIVKIHNVAVGGTDSLYALPVLEYRLYPVHLDILRKQGADIIVNAYSANENLFSWDGSEDATADLRHFHACLLFAKSFYHGALKSQPCPPLVLFVDEYIGNLNKLLLGEDIRNDVIRMLTDTLNDMGYISSSLVARHWVYANTSETLFTPDWLTKPEKPEVHFGMPAHQHVTWVVAYSILKSVMEFCEDIDDVYATFLHGDVEANAFQSKGTSGINEPQSAAVLDCNTGSATSSEHPCSFAFVATRAGTVTTEKELNQYIEPFKISSSSGWEGEDNQRDGGWRKRLGLVAHRVGATIRFSIPNLSNQVRVITIHFLKSYGPEWVNSQAHFSFAALDSAGRRVHEVSYKLSGHHNESTSRTFRFTLDLKEKAVEVGHTATLNITLVSGKSFKISSLMMCSR
jgi:hypothetical protein